MSPPKYRYTFDPGVPVGDLEETLLLAVIATESLHGESQTRLDLDQAFDAAARAAVVDASTDVGRDFNRLFVGFAAREFGRRSFQVERVAAKLEPATV
ncbi:hypothetical protein [Gemmata sp.]|uniref:hypothetical protein n=1 Tax=Gemmata sp. TaxID=1914242 RepID=UPI003F6EA067